jgi:hypothetical protein
MIHLDGELKGADDGEMARMLVRCRASLVSSG